MHPGSVGWHGRWPSRPPGAGMPRSARLWVPVVISLIVQVPGAFLEWHGRGLSPIPAPTGPFALGLVLALVGPLALIGARRFPGPVVAVAATAASLDLFVGRPEGGPPYLALAFAIISAIVRGARGWAWISVAVAWVVTLSTAGLVGAAWAPFRIAATTLGILLVFGIGEAIRGRKERFEQMSRVRVQRRQSEVQAERVRIARELHDVLAHSLSQINVVAGVGLHLIDTQPEKARDALASIKETSKSALSEVRSVLGVLRADAPDSPEAPLVPEPDLSRIQQLADSLRAQGVEVSVSDIPSDVPQATQLAIYRIVQESLTNVIRHASASRASVEIGEADGFYTVTVTDNGTAPPRPAEGGRGLLGMNERAELLGGSLEAAPQADGGFRVSARIPALEADGVR